MIHVEKTQVFRKPKTQRQLLLSALFLGGMCYFFLVVFQPFGTYAYRNNYKYLVLLPYSGIVMVSFLLSSLWNRKKSSEWSWMGQMQQSGFVLVLTSVLSYLYNAWAVSHHPLSLGGWLEMLLYTLLLGFPIYLTHSLLVYAFFRGPLQEEEKRDESLDSTAVVYIQTDLMQEVFTLNQRDFLYAKAEGNYCQVYFLSDGRVQQQLMRLPLKKLKEQFTLEAIVYCHRSYIVNTSYVQRVKGNAQGGKLQLQELGDFLPISRTYFPFFIAHKRKLS